MIFGKQWGVLSIIPITLHRGGQLARILSQRCAIEESRVLFDHWIPLHGLCLDPSPPKS